MYSDRRDDRESRDYDHRSGSNNNNGQRGGYNYEDNQGYSTGYSVQRATNRQQITPADSPPRGARDDSWQDVWRNNGDEPRRERSRSPPRRRSRSRSPRRRRRSRSRSRSPDRRRQRTPTPPRDWQSQTPSNTVVITRLPNAVDENTLWLRLASDAVSPIDIRMARRANGNSEGYAYIEFADDKAATAWMMATQGTFALDERTTSYLEYDDGQRERSFDTMANSGGRRDALDWICVNCKVLNFARRDRCFKCGEWGGITMRQTDTKGDHDVGLVPCDTLLLRDLPLGCIEADIAQALGKVSALTPVRISMASNQRFAYLQMGSVLDAQRVHTMLTTITKLIIASHKITVSFSTMPLSTMGALNMTDNSNKMTTAFGEVAPQRFCADPSQADRSNAAAAVAQNAMARSRLAQPVSSASSVIDDGSRSAAARMLANAQAQLSQHSMTMMSAPPPALNPAMMLLLQQQNMAQSMVHDAQQRQIASLALTQMQAAQRAQASNKPAGGTVQTPHGLLPVYPEPDTSTYQYEAQSGYYFDPATGLYYDGKSRLYFNGEMRKWLYWNGEFKTYLPCAESKEETTVKEEDKEGEKAKNIAKEMEEWAKKQSKANKKKSVISMQIAKPKQAESPPVSAPSSDIAYAMLNQKKKLEAFADTRSDTEEKSQQVESVVDTHIDWQSLTCLVCRRKFDKEAKLSKHVNMSDLHKKNMALLLDSAQTASSSSSTWVDEMERSNAESAKNIAYRDRAAERRTKFGHEQPAGSIKVARNTGSSPEALSSWTSSTPSSSAAVPFEQPNLNGINAENKGNKMLRGMGWRDGEGLGLKGQGITAPIQADLRAKGVGLGMQGAEQLSADASYRQKLMHSMRSKFDAMK